MSSTLKQRERNHSSNEQKGDTLLNSNETSSSLETNSTTRKQYENRQHITRTHMSITTFLCYILLVLFFGSYLFKKGFLLSRPTLENKNLDTSILVEPKYKKLIIVIVDALRYDFVAPSNEYGNENASLNSNFRDRMPLLQKKIQLEKEHSLLFEFLADAPTTTLQRLKALTTGSLPTFVDAGANFAATDIFEDNWVDQMLLKNKTIRFAGDDTWVSLFPKQLTNPYPFDSFDVHDLDTVDNGIRGKYDKIFYNKDSENKWDTLIFHFLGVDHAGHRYGPDHPEMGRKLEEMDKFIDDLYNKIDEDTLVTIFGDHGMDRKGDHGGDTLLETQAALVLLSKKKLRDPAQQKKAFEKLGILDQWSGRFNKDLNRKEHQLANFRSIRQIDLVPTLSLLLGLNIPFNNLGMIIPELFLNNLENDGIQFANAIMTNLNQVHNYLNTFNLKYPKESLTLDLKLKEKYDKCLLAYQNYLKNPDHLESLHELTHHGFDYLRANLKLCQDIWARFDTNYIIMGLILMLLSCVVVTIQVFLRSKPKTTLENTKDNNPYFTTFNTYYGQMFIYLLFGGIIGGIIGLTLKFDNQVEKGDQFIFFSLFFSLLGYFLNSFIDYLNDGSFSLNLKRLGNTSLQKVLIVCNLINLVFILPLNGMVRMVIFEDRYNYLAMQYCHLSLLGYSLYLKYYKKLNELKVLNKKLIYLVLSLIVLSTLQYQITICREEQMPLCHPTFHTFLNFDNTSTVASQPILILATISIFLLPRMFKFLLNSTKNYYTSAPYWFEIGFPISLGCICVGWWLDNQTSSVFQLISVITLKVWIFRCGIIGGLLFGLMAFFTNPILLDVNMIETKDDHNISHRSMVIMGIGNGYGAPQLLFLSIGLIPLLATQSPMGGISLSLSVIQLLIFLEVYDILRDFELTLKKIKLPFETKMIDLIPSLSLTFFMTSWLYLLANQAFFATGHQATLNSIQWKMGFVGLFETNYYLSPFLILLNTIPGQLLSSLGCLLLHYWKLAPSRPALFKTLPYTLIRVVLFSTLLKTLDLTQASLFAAYHRRHLMVWKLFAPRYLSALIQSFSGLVILLFIGLFFPSVVVLNEVGDVVALLKDE